MQQTKRALHKYDARNRYRNCNYSTSTLSIFVRCYCSFTSSFVRARAHTHTNTSMGSSKSEASTTNATIKWQRQQQRWRNFCVLEYNLAYRTKSFWVSNSSFESEQLVFNVFRKLVDSKLRLKLYNKRRRKARKNEWASKRTSAANIK